MKWALLRFLLNFLKSDNEWWLNDAAGQARPWVEKMQWAKSRSLISSDLQWWNLGLRCAFNNLQFIVINMAMMRMMMVTMMTMMMMTVMVVMVRPWWVEPCTDVHSSLAMEFLMENYIEILLNLTIQQFCRDCAFQCIAYCVTKCRNVRCTVLKNSSAGFDQKKWLAKVAQLEATWGPLCCTLYNFVTWKYYELIINYTLCILNWGPLDCAIHNCPNVCQLFFLQPLLHKCAHSLIPHSTHSTHHDTHSRLSFVHYYYTYYGPCQLEYGTRHRKT